MAPKSVAKRCRESGSVPASRSDEVTQSVCISTCQQLACGAYEEPLLAASTRTYSLCGPRSSGGCGGVLRSPPTLNSPLLLRFVPLPTGVLTWSGGWRRRPHSNSNTRAPCQQSPAATYSGSLATARVHLAVPRGRSPGMQAPYTHTHAHACAYARGMSPHMQPPTDGSLISHSLYAHACACACAYASRSLCIFRYICTCTCIGTCIDISLPMPVGPTSYRRVCGGGLDQWRVRGSRCCSSRLRHVGIRRGCRVASGAGRVHLSTHTYVRMHAHIRELLTYTRLVNLPQSSAQLLLL